MSARNIFGSLVIALVLFSFWPFVVGRYQQVGALRQALAERQALVDEREAALENFTEELDRFQSRLSGDDLDKFSAMVPENKSTAELLSTLDALANGTGMRLLEAGISEASSGRSQDVTKTLTINMQLEGRYASFKSYLSQLEQSVRLLDVQTLEMSSSDIVGEIRFSVQAKAYFLQ